MLKYGKAFDLRTIRCGLFSEGLFCVIFFFLKLFYLESEPDSKIEKMLRKFVFELNSYFPAKIFSRYQVLCVENRSGRRDLCIMPWGCCHVVSKNRIYFLRVGKWASKQFFEIASGFLQPLRVCINKPHAEPIVSPSGHNCDGFFESSSNQIENA